ncbi:MAG: alpha/beta fold hydrolase [Bacteroidota bacterium]
MKTRTKILLWLCISGPLLWLVGSYLGSMIATRSQAARIPLAKTFFTTPVENVELRAKDQVLTQAWYLPDPSNSKQKAVILLNGLRGNRLGMIERAKLYHQTGYAVLLPDLRGTGASTPSLITFGWKERLDLLAGVAFLQKAGYSEIAVHGTSLGAATIVYSFNDNPDYAFVVLESCYDNIDQALANRVERFHLPSWVYQPLKHITAWRTGVPIQQLYPERDIPKGQFPTLILAGDAEQRVRKTETEKLFQQCGAKDKQLHFFRGAKHEDFLRRYDEEYRSVLHQWLVRQQKALPTATNPPF